MRKDRLLDYGGDFKLGMSLEMATCLHCPTGATAGSQRKSVACCYDMAAPNGA